MVLGLDLSTNTIGIALLKEDEKLHCLEFLVLKKEKDLFSKALIFKEFIEKNYKALNITKIGIEEPLVMFREGYSRAQILSKLSMFNGMCTAICHEIFKIKPIHLHVSTARKLAFPELKFPQGSNRKVLVYEQVDKKYPGIQWKYSSRGNFSKLNYDMADAATVAIATIRL